MNAEKSDHTRYHTQPHTLDTNVEIPDDAPLAQGHDEDAAAAVQEQQEALREQVDSEPEEVVTAREPGDHAGSDKDKDKDKDKDDKDKQGKDDDDEKRSKAKSAAKQK
jgi:hypothetical protein